MGFTSHASVLLRSHLVLVFLSFCQNHKPGFDSCHLFWPDIPTIKFVIMVTSALITFMLLTTVIPILFQFGQAQVGWLYLSDVTLSAIEGLVKQCTLSLLVLLFTIANVWSRVIDFSHYWGYSSLLTIYHTFLCLVLTPLQCHNFTTICEGSDPTMSN